jgi:Fe-S cluster biogenesis protein NfuA
MSRLFITKRYGKNIKNNYDSGMLYQMEKLFDEQIRPALASHGGSIDIVDIDNGILYIKFKGGCQGCSSASATLRGGVEKLVREKFPEIQEIIDTTSHSEGQSPYM